MGSRLGLVEVFPVVVCAGGVVVLTALCLVAVVIGDGAPLPSRITRVVLVIGEVCNGDVLGFVFV